MTLVVSSGGHVFGGCQRFSEYWFVFHGTQIGDREGTSSHYLSASAGQGDLAAPEGGMASRVLASRLAAAPSFPPGPEWSGPPSLPPLALSLSLQPPPSHGGDLSTSSLWTSVYFYQRLVCLQKIHKKMERAFMHFVCDYMRDDWTKKVIHNLLWKA